MNVNLYSKASIVLWIVSLPDLASSTVNNTPRSRASTRDNPLGLKYPTWHLPLSLSKFQLTSCSIAHCLFCLDQGVSILNTEYFGRIHMYFIFIDQFGGKEGEATE